VQTIIFVGVYFNEADHAYAAALEQRIRDTLEQDEIEALVETRVVKVPARD
jgi:hypothetical protein